MAGTVNFGQIKSRIKTDIKGNKTSADDLLPYIGNAVQSAINFYDGSRFWFLEKRASLTLPSSTESVSVPTDFVAEISLRALVSSVWMGADDGFRSVSPDEYHAIAVDSTATGDPQVYTFFAGSILVYPRQSSSLSLELVYIKGDAATLSDNDTSVWFGDGQELIRLKAMAIFYQDTLHDDTNGQRYEALAEAERKRLLSRHNTRQFTHRLRG